MDDCGIETTHSQFGLIRQGTHAFRQVALQQRLHLAPPIGNHKNNGTLSNDSVDDAARLEENLPIRLGCHQPRARLNPAFFLCCRPVQPHAWVPGGCNWTVPAVVRAHE
jgi:hypothetical protein